jgi:ribosomal protein S12 methylthiotransferase
MELQRKIARERNRFWIGREMEVLVEGIDGKRFSGRSFREAPEVDGRVLLRAKDCRVGDIITARILNADSYNLYAEEVER